MRTKTAYQIGRWVMAILFIFSGLAKSVNPFGFSIQIGEYLTAMNLQFLRPLAPLGGILIPSFEVALGVMLLLGLSKRFTAWGVMLFMSFFTVLTFWIAIANPVNDCGCFGDVWKISNWQTFWKNILLTPFAILVFINRKLLPSSTWHLYWFAIPVSLLLSVYSYVNLPFIDATPYKIGVNIPEAMSVPKDAPQQESHTLLVYKNIASGEIRKFEIDDPQWQDDTKWEYVDTETQIISEGYVPPIKSLPMLDRNGRNHTSEVLAREGQLMLIVINNLSSVGVEVLDRVAGRQSGSVVLLTSSPLPEDNTFHNLEVYNCDYTVINTIIQHFRGGALIIKNGVIEQKLVMRDLLEM